MTTPLKLQLSWNPSKLIGKNTLVSTTRKPMLVATLFMEEDVESQKLTL